MTPGSAAWPAPTSRFANGSNPGAGMPWARAPVRPRRDLSPKLTPMREETRSPEARATPLVARPQAEL
jgi:hypothetical protein